MRKPDSVVYWLETKPPLTIALIITLQQLSFLGVYLVLSPVFVHNVPGIQVGPAELQRLMSSTLLASGVGVLLQAYGGRLGSGLFCPLQITSASFSALGIAATQGGLDLALGMTCFIGLSQLCCSELFKRMRGIFSVEIAGLTVMLMGLGMGSFGLKLVTMPDEQAWDTTYDLEIACATIGIMILCNGFSRGRLRLFSAFTGLVGGSVISFMIKGMDANDLSLMEQANYFGLPEFDTRPWHFDVALIPSFALTGLMLALHGFGALTLAQRFNDADWKRPDMHNIGQGLRAEGLSNIISSLLEGLPITGSGGAVGMAAATGCTSRVIAFWLGLMFIVIAFLPKIFVLWYFIPEPVVGASVIFLSIFTTVAGLQMIASRLLDNRKIIAVGMGLITGASFEPLSAFYQQLPGFLHSFTFSGVIVGVTVAVSLSALFRIRSDTRIRKAFALPSASIDDLIEFLEQQGRAWGARAEIIRRAEYATWQALEILTDHALAANGKIEIETIYDEFSFTVILNYGGETLSMPQHPPSHEEFLADEGAVLLMAGYLLRKLADNVRSRENAAGMTQLVLTFKD